MFDRLAEIIDAQDLPTLLLMVVIVAAIEHIIDVFFEDWIEPRVIDVNKEPPPSGYVRVYINSGHLSVDNGCVAPLTNFVELGKLLNAEREFGIHYYDDSLVIEEKDLPTVIDILTELKFLYKIQGEHDQWQNVLTSKVRNNI